MRLQDRTAVITGAASGIGRATALAFADHGADVIVADTREQPRRGGTPTVTRITDETDRRAEYVACDVRDPATVETALEAAEALGGLDVLVNNAGVFHHGDPLETTPDEYDRVADVNARGTFFATQAAGRRLAEADGGTIINVASTSGFRAEGPITAYGMSKAAVMHLTRGFADALGPAGVRVNAVCPGAIDTALSRDRSPAERDALVESIPSRRIGDPADVADTIVFLASDAADYITGETLVVDGGLSL